MPCHPGPTDRQRVQRTAPPDRVQNVVAQRAAARRDPLARPQRHEPVRAARMRARRRCNRSPHGLLTGRLSAISTTDPHPTMSRHETPFVRPRCRPHAADALHDGPARPAVRRVRGRPVLALQRGPGADAADRDRHRRVPVLHVRQARARCLRREDRDSREEAPELHDMVERLCALADLPKPRVAIMDTPVPNAFATGRSPKHAAVCVTTGLWDRLEPKEVEGVLAHELSHIANRDVLIMTVASFFAMLAAMLTRFGLYAGMWGGGRRDNNNNGPPVWLIVLAVSIVDLRGQLRPDPHDLALPRVLRRPRLGPDHRRARVPDERAAEDLVADDADPEPGPASGRGHERLLHHPGEGQVGAPPSCSWITRRSRSGSRLSPRSRARWAARSRRRCAADGAARRAASARRSCPSRRTTGSSHSRRPRSRCRSSSA